MRKGRLSLFFGFIAAGVIFNGCGKENAATRAPSPWPRLLSESEVRSFFEAEKELNLRGKTPQELRMICTLRKEDIEYALDRFGFTVESFLETAELIFFARFGREIFVDLPRRKRALVTELLKRLKGPEYAKLREKLERELNEPETGDRRFVTVVLANAHVLSEYEKKYGKPEGGK